MFRQKSVQIPNWIWILGAAILCAAYFRLESLGALGYRGDEDIQTLAVKGILAHGYPEMPSGMIYLRSTWFLYVQAAFAKLFGVDEFALRLPAAIFSIAAIVLGFSFTKRLFGTKTAMVVAWVMALAFEEIVFGRMARMYAPFMTLYLTTVYVFYIKCVDTETLQPILPTILGVITVLTHQLGFTLALLYLFPIISRRQPAKSIVGLLLGGGAIIISFLFAQKSIRMALEYLYGDKPASTESDVGMPEASSAVVSFLRQILSNVDWPDLGLLRVTADLLETNAAAVAVLLFAVGMIVLWLIRPKDSTQANLATYVGVGVPIVLAASLHQLNVVFILLMLVGIVRNRGISGLLSPESLRIAFVSSAMLSAWFVFGINHPDLVGKIKVSHFTTFQGMYRELGDFPNLSVVWGFLRERPISSILAVLGMLWSIENGVEQTKGKALRYVLYVFAAGLIVTGLFESTYDYFRYIMHFDPFFIILATIGFRRGSAVIRVVINCVFPTRPQRYMSKRVASVCVTMLGIAAVSIEFNPISSWYVANRYYGDPNAFAKARHFAFYTDFRSPTKYLLEHKSESDIVVVLDSRETYNYLGHVDYWITTHARELRDQTYVVDGFRKDIYVDTPVLSNLEMFQEVLNAASNRTVWLIASDKQLDKPTTITPAIADLIRSYKRTSVFLGQDEAQRVYRIDPGTSPRHPIE